MQEYKAPTYMGSPRPLLPSWIDRVCILNVTLKSISLIVLTSLKHYQSVFTAIFSKLEGHHSNNKFIHSPTIWNLHLCIIITNFKFTSIHYRCTVYIYSQTIWNLHLCIIITDLQKPPITYVLHCSSGRIYCILQLRSALN